MLGNESSLILPDNQSDFGHPVAPIIPLNLIDETDNLVGR